MELFKLWLEYYLRTNVERSKAKIYAGADAIMENDDFTTSTGPMISPKNFREYILPNLRRLCDLVHKKGAFFVKHKDGNINLILNEIVSAHIDGLYPLEESAGMNMVKVKADYDARVCVLGNVGLSLGGISGSDRVIEETLQCIMEASQDGGYIMTTSNVITADAQERNFMAWLETTRKYGRYPIRKPGH
ncbi:MAG: uroporphyrinogen decarboxylase family protein [Nitrososphaeria archaeon]